MISVILISLELCPDCNWNFSLVLYVSFSDCLILVHCVVSVDAF